jgi:hypothetical protein
MTSTPQLLAEVRMVFIDPTVSNADRIETVTHYAAQLRHDPEGLTNLRKIAKGIAALMRRMSTRPSSTRQAMAAITETPSPAMRVEPQ